MNILSKWVNLILLWTTLINLVLCASNITNCEDDDDSVVVEARSLPVSTSRNGRQIQYINPIHWFQVFAEGSGCLASSGVIGSCTRFRTCYPNYRSLNQLMKQTEHSPWVLQGQETCNFFDEYGQQATGICCFNTATIPDRDHSNDDSGEIPTGTTGTLDGNNDISYDPPEDIYQTGQESAESGEQYQFNWPSQSGFVSPVVATWPPPIPTHPPSISQWPPQVPTHPPDHHYPTHPPYPGLPTHPSVTVTSARPIYPTYRPTSTPKPSYPTYPITSKPIPRPPDHGSSAMNMCGAKNGVSPDQERIVGGQNSSPNEWPWIVVLFNKGKQFCGGTLIDNIHVLTAAHCVARMTSWDVAGLSANLGDHNIRTSFEVQHVERKIKRLVRHKGFDFGTLHNDVAVLTLDRPVIFTREIHPICLPHTSARKSFIGQIATVAGWGSLRENGPQPSILQKVNIPIWANAECARKYGRAAPGGIIESMICAGQAARDSCSGDSGGPLMLNEGGSWIQIGIVSWGIGCGKGQYPGVYTRVTALLPWILKNLK